MIIKDPKNSRVFYFWQILFLFAFLIEIVLVPYTSWSKSILYILDEYTKPLEQVIDAIWIMNIILQFLTPFEIDFSQQDDFSDIALRYLFHGFVFDVLSTLTLLFNYEYQWMYYLKFLRAIYFLHALKILEIVTDDIAGFFSLSKQARSNVQSILRQFIILFTIMHLVACGWILVGEHD